MSAPKGTREVQTYGAHTAHNLDNSATWRGAGMAVQPQLGVWTKRWSQPARIDRDRTLAVASVLS